MIMKNWQKIIYHYTFSQTDLPLMSNASVLGYGFGLLLVLIGAKVDVFFYTDLHASQG